MVGVLVEKEISASVVVAMDARVLGKGVGVSTEVATGITTPTETSSC